MKKLTVMIGTALLVPTIAGAGPVTIPNTFQSNTPAVAAEVNGNFGAVKDAVDDNDARITGLETGNAACAGNDATDIMVKVGPLCADRYEASVWDSAAGGGTQFGLVANTNNNPCEPNGSNCANIYARSEANREPSSQTTWFQAAAACANVGKRLPTNAEWQLLALGTDETNCNT
ncbi:MAG: SUMF1/EgtB/PvdO family nonheme iron enzyme, partial [Gammaproteobacteria bacterium]